MKVSTENENNFRYKKITIVVDNIPLKKWKQIKNIITIFDWNQNLIGCDISL